MHPRALLHRFAWQGHVKLRTKKRAAEIVKLREQNEQKFSAKDGGVLGGGDLAVNGPFSEYRTSPSSSSRYFSQTSPENRCFNAPGAVLQAEVGVHPCSPGIGEIGEKDTHDSTCFLSPFAHYLIIIIIYHHYPFISDGFVFALQNPFRWVSWWKVLDRIIRLSQSDHPKLCSIVQLCKTVKSWCEATNAQQREKVRSLEWSKSHG